jgi:hypothetical protein
MLLQDYSFNIEHVKGRTNCVTDCLSRYPIDSPVDIDIEQHSTSTQTDNPMNIVSAVTTRSMNHHLDSPSSELSPTTSTEIGQQQPIAPRPLEQQQQPTAPRLLEQQQQSTNQIQVFTKEQLKNYQQQD